MIHVLTAAADAGPVRGGRPKKLADPKQFDFARALFDGGQTDIANI
jgi:hypothetical protein